MKRMTLTEHSDALELMNISDAEKWRLHCLRKNFGKQTLTLGMFLPCNNDGSVMEEPCEQTGGIEIYSEKYQQAKDRVLFKTWKIDKVINGETHISCNVYFGLAFDSNGIKIGNITNTVEDTFNRTVSATEYGISQFNIGITQHETK